MKYEKVLIIIWGCVYSAAIILAFAAMIHSRHLSK